MKVNYSAGKSLARSRIRASVQGRARYLGTVKNSRKSTSSRLSSVNKSNKTNVYGNVGNSAKVDLYTDVENSAKAIGKSLKSLMQTGEDSLFVQNHDVNKEKTDESNEVEKKAGTAYQDEIQKFVKQYNVLIDALTDLSDTSSKVYLANLKSDMSGHSKALAQIGIKTNKDGTLKLDEKMLDVADEAQVEGLFGSKGLVSTKVYRYAESLEKNAASNLKALNGVGSAGLNNMYNRYGNATNSYYNSRYSYRG